MSEDLGTERTTSNGNGTGRLRLSFGEKMDARGDWEIRRYLTREGHA